MTVSSNLSCKSKGMYAMRLQMTAIIKKDLQRIVSSKRMFICLLVVPLVLTIIMPTIFLLTTCFVPEKSTELDKLLELLPITEQSTNFLENMAGLILNYALPIFFLIIPIMSSTIMSATSFVGEKEKQTLETLLYCPLSLTQIFQAKVAASFLLSMLVSCISFSVMLIVLETEIYVTAGLFILPGIQWLLVMLLLAPALSLIAVTLIVRISAKAQSVEDAQQGAVFLLLPILLMLISQFSGLFLISAWMLLGLGVVCAVFAGFLLKRAMGRFTYESLHASF